MITLLPLVAPSMVSCSTQKYWMERADGKKRFAGYAFLSYENASLNFKP